MGLGVVGAVGSKKLEHGCRGFLPVHHRSLVWGWRVVMFFLLYGFYSMEGP